MLASALQQYDRTGQMRDRVSLDHGLDKTYNKPAIRPKGIRDTGYGHTARMSPARGYPSGFSNDRGRTTGLNLILAHLEADEQTAVTCSPFSVAQPDRRRMPRLRNAVRAGYAAPPSGGAGNGGTLALELR